MSLFDKPLDTIPAPKMKPPKRKMDISIPPRVAFVNTTDGGVFFDCSPAEARYAKKMVEMYREKREDAFEDIAGEVERFRPIAKAICEKFPNPEARFTMCFNSSSMNISGLSMMFNIIEVDMDSTITVVFCGPRRLHDFRMWGRDIIDYYPREFSMITGIHARLWGADIVVDDIPNDRIVLCSPRSPKIDKPQAWVFKLSMPEV